MPITINSTNRLKVNVDYLISPEHRPGGNHLKSKWNITPDQEFDCFKLCFVNNWIVEDTGWGIIVQGSRGKFVLLGHSSNRVELFLAKFIGGNPWHGYPANIKENIHDRPKHVVLMSWYEKELIHKHQISRIKNGRL